MELLAPKSLGTSGHWKVEAAGCTILRTIPAHFLDLLDTGRAGGGGGVYGTGSYVTVKRTRVVLGLLRRFLSVYVVIRVEMT